MRLKWVWLGFFLMLLSTVLAQPFSFEDERFSWEALEPFRALNLSGQVITILGPWTNKEQQQFETVLHYFTEATGAAIRYGYSESLGTAIPRAFETGNLPHIAIIPQISQVKEFAASGILIPLAQEHQAAVSSTYVAASDWLDLASFEDAEGQEQLYGFFFASQLEGLVWYSKSAFKQQGYGIPESMEELFLLTEKIAREGQVPWCIGFAAGDFTGWPASNWVENIIIRQAGADSYDRWIKRQLPFADPKIVQAVESFGRIVKQDSFVLGGAIGQANIRFNKAVEGLFSDPSECYLYFSGGFIADEPDTFVVADDLGVFYFPNFITNQAKPGIVVAPLISLTTDSEAARYLLRYLQTPLAHELLVAQGKYLSPYLGLNPELYTTDYLRQQGQILSKLTEIRLDASEQMPGPVRAAFYGVLMDYISGADISDLNPAIDAIWDSLE